jgi:hypothetical protein
MPATLGNWMRIDTPLTTQVIQALTASETGADIKGSGVAFYGTDEADPAFLLVGLRVDPARAGDARTRIDRLLAGLAAAPTSSLDPTTRTDKTDGGITFTCGTAMFGSRATAYCSWSQNDLTAIGFSLPPAGPTEVDSVEPLAAEAAPQLH